MQQARGALREADPKCVVLAPMEPLAKCGSTTGVAYNRVDINCEMLLWQSEELGDGDEGEYKKNGCPWPGPLKEHDERHSGRLMEDQLPKWAAKLVHQKREQYKKNKKELRAKLDSLIQISKNQLRSDA